MGVRGYRARKFMPSGMIAVLRFVMLNFIILVSKDMLVLITSS